MKSPEEAVGLKIFGTQPNRTEESRTTVSKVDSGRVYYIPEKIKAWKPIIGQRELQNRWDSSAQFCWLLIEFGIESAGHTRIDSYVNKLHPIVHADLYSIIFQVFSHLLPYWNQVVTDLAHPSRAESHD